MTITINNVALDNYILQTPITQTKDAELDKATIQIKVDNELSLNKYDKVVISDTNINFNKTFCLFDYVEKYEGEKILYTINLLSPTKLLENIIVNGMAITNTSYTAIRQFTLALEKIETQMTLEYGITFTFTYNDLSNVLGSQIAQEYFWNGQTTAREILDDILEVAGYRAIVSDYTIYNRNITSIHISYEAKDTIYSNIELANGTTTKEALQNLNNGLNNANKITGFETFNDSEYQVDNIISIVKNGATNNLIETPFLPLRDDDLVDDTGNYYILTQEPIYELKEVKMLYTTDFDDGIAFTYVGRIEQGNIIQGSFGLNSKPDIGILIDITSYIVEKSEWDIMSIDDQKKHLYYKKGERGIYGVLKIYKSEFIWHDTAIWMILHDIFDYHLNLAGQISEGIPTIPYTNVPILKLNSNKQWEQTQYTIKNGAWKVNDVYTLRIDNTMPNNDYEKHYLFKVKYTSYCDALFKNSSEKNGNVKNLSIIKNQNDRTIDLYRYDASQQSMIERLGNREAHLDQILSYYGTGRNNMWKLGDYISVNNDKWIITKREFTPYNTGYKIRYTFSFNYNARNSQINLKREKRIYDIPLNNIIDRYIIVKKQYWSSYNAILIPCYDLEGDNTRCYLDIIKYGGGHTQYGIVRFKDNYACDVYRAKYNDTTLNVSLRYTNQNGELTNLTNIGLTTSSYVQNNIEHTNELPKVDDVFLINYFSLDNIYKDKFERLILVFVE